MKENSLKQVNGFLNNHYQAYICIGICPETGEVWESYEAPTRMHQYALEQALRNCLKDKAMPSPVSTFEQPPENPEDQVDTI